MDKIPYRLPLVIGATGHRDLRDQDIPALEAAVSEIIERLKQAYLEDTRWFCRMPGLSVACRWLGLCTDRETPIVVLSSLAEGADRLIAEVAMRLGAKLIAPLPMDPDEYRYDFGPEKRIKPDAAEKFDELRGLALAAPVMPLVGNNSLENVKEESRRALQYREVGMFIVRHCHVLIALWNGEEHDPAVGGTAEVVSFKRDGIPLDAAASVRASLDAPEMGPVIHVLTPRAKAGGKVNEVEVCSWGKVFVRHYRGNVPLRMWNSFTQFVRSAFGAHRADDSLPTCKRERRAFQSWEAFETKSDLTRRFNREAAHLERSGKREEQLGVSFDYLFNGPHKESEKKLLADQAKECAAKLIPHWCSLYQLADTLAQERQDRFVFDWRLLFGLGFLAIACFEVGTHLAFDSKWLFFMLGLYGFSFIVIFGFFVYARVNQHQERFLDYRALAEALRVAVFWKLVGIGWLNGKKPDGKLRSSVDLTSRNAISDAYPIRQPSELDWVKTCLRTLELVDSDKSFADLKHSITAEGDRWAHRFWVQGQLAFFRRRGPQHDHHAEELENRSFILVVISLVSALALCGVDLMLLDGKAHDTIAEIHEYWPHRIAILLIGLLPGLAAVWTGYSERRALKAQARQYDRMRVMFERANDILQLPRPADFSEIQVLYAELGAEAMEENAEWVAIYRQRPIRPP